MTKYRKEWGSAAAYLRTSSAANVNGDSEHRQRAAISAYAERAGFRVEIEHYDAAISGADPVEARPGLVALIEEAVRRNITLILVEDASRLARSLVAQELGLALLAKRGIRVVTAGGDDLTNTADPSRVMMRQISGAFSEFEKARTVQKLAAARNRASEALGRRVEGRKGHAQTNPGLVEQARRLGRRNPKTGKTRSLRQIAVELQRIGFSTATGKTFGPSQIERLLKSS